MGNDERLSQALDGRIAAYLGLASATSAAIASNADGAVVAHTTAIPFGLNEEVNIDFNGDGAAEFQIDHDRVNLNGTDLDYLQLDKNDASSAANPLAQDVFATFPGTFEPNRADYTGDGVGSWDQNDLTAWENQFGWVNDPDNPNPDFHADGNLDNVVDGRDFLIWQSMTVKKFSYDQGYIYGELSDNYVSALTEGTSIGPDDFYTFQETTNYSGFGLSIHANRLIDEDNGQIDTDAGIPAYTMIDTPHFLGLGGATRYLGVRFDLNDEGFAGSLNSVNGPDDTDDPANYWYGWIGVQITNEADATGVVTGWAYEDQIGTAIMAGDVGSSSAANAVPEPGTMLLAVASGITLVGGFAWRKIFR